MNSKTIDIQEMDLLVEIRRFIRTVEKYSSKLAQKYGVTVAQLVILQEIVGQEKAHESDIGERLTLSPKVTREMIDRLIRLNIIKVEGDSELSDDRSIISTDEGKKILRDSPPLLQDLLLESLKGINEWQKNMLLASFQRINNLLESENISAAPILTTGDITEPEPTTDTEINRIVREEKTDVNLVKIDTVEQLEKHITTDELTVFLRKHMSPFDDSRETTKQGIVDALSDVPHRGGFIILAENENTLVGALVMLSTGMKNYIPGYCLLFIGVDSSERGSGIGQQIMNYALGVTKGDVYLHVEEKNPAKRLYERLGFKHAYSEMRYYPTEVNIEQ